MRSALPLRVATLNVRGLKSRRKQHQLLKLLRPQRIDILAVKETKLSEEHETDIALEPSLADFEICVSHACGTSAGCFLFLKKATDFSSISLTIDQEGRFISCDLTYDGEDWLLMCVYAPNTVSARNVFSPFVAHHFGNR
ncbi:unnamed protein product [Ixodes hexagonus]